jgi:thiamine biosynthesis protein ThiI
MEQLVRENLDGMFTARGLDTTLNDEHTRLYVHTDPELVEDVAAVAAKTFGVSSVSSVLQVDPTMDAICGALSETASEHYDGERFAVRARRAGQESAHPFSSTDLEQEGGTAVFETAADAGSNPVVDLEDPEMTFRIECRPEKAFVYLERRDGAGGLPLGTQEPVVALVSGGIDSPVAAWQMMKRGCPIVPVYIDLGKFGGVDHRARAEETVRRLAAYTPTDLPLWVVSAEDGLADIVETTHQYRMIHVRRFMLRIGAALAETTDAVGLVTGESIGQKSSQTSASIRVTSPVTDIPVHRPVLTLDKHEISDRARTIGTYDDATIDAGCHRLAPDNPATHPPLDRVREVEPDGLKRAASRAVEQAETLAVPPQRL